MPYCKDLVLVFFYLNLGNINTTMFDLIFILKFKELQKSEMYISYLLFMHKLQFLLPHSYHTSNDLAIRPQGSSVVQEKYCSAFQLFSNYF